ncbi:MAG: hypothetical protein Q8P36_01925 [bacterium]|nr:hypothetical protein [bacterium]
MAQQENDIDSLARMVADGFKSVEKNMNEQFAEVDKRFDEMGQEIDARFDKVDTRLDSLDKEVHQINQRIDHVVMPALDEHSRRIKDLETSVA